MTTTDPHYTTTLLLNGTNIELSGEGQYDQLSREERLGGTLALRHLTNPHSSGSGFLTTGFITLGMASSLERRAKLDVFL